MGKEENAKKTKKEKKDEEVRQWTGRDTDPLMSAPQTDQCIDWSLIILGYLSFILHSCLSVDQSFQVGLVIEYTLVVVWGCFVVSSTIS